MAEGADAVTARDFVEGENPRGKTLFIDAVEEYRIGEAGHDRLDQLLRAIKRSRYERWRLTCRALSPPDLRLIERYLGKFETWQLAPLDDLQQKAVLKSLGAPNPEAVIQRVDDLAAGSLMGNPATLKLLYQTLHTATQPIESRGGLFSHATEAMATGMNEDLPERPDRSTPGAIVTAAEKASTVLMLSAREHLWMLGANPPEDGMVVRDDLLPAEVDIQALRDAVDTAMFRGEAGRYTPTHRMVAEYLAGRYLAAAVSGIDGAPAALPYGRAYALLCGANDSPVPALMGVFAWFVTFLAHGPHSDRALALVCKYPEAILFQGDPAMLPPTHRQALLDATGRRDPWFLSTIQGATAVGGLAGPDMEDRFRDILKNNEEAPHRRGMVLEAIAAGRRMPGLDADIERIVVDPLYPEWLRRRALETVIARVPNPNDTLRRIVTRMEPEAPNTAMTVKLQALTHLVGVDVTTAEAHAALEAYVQTGNGVMGYSRAFTYALEQNPPVDFFDSPIDVRKKVGQSRSYEVASGIERILVAVIRAQPTAKADDILRWLANAGFEEGDDPHENVRHAICDWVNLAPGRARNLFWTLFNQFPERAYYAPLAWSRLVGGEVPPNIVSEVFKRVKAEKPGQKANQLAWLAYQLFGGFDASNAVYWLLWEILEPRPDLAEVFEAMTFVPMTHWQVQQGRAKFERATQRDASIDEDREWMSANVDKLRSGIAVDALEIAALHYCGHIDHGDGYGRECLVGWVGEEITEAIREGWTVVMSNFPLSWREQAEAEGLNAYTNFLAASWAEDRIIRGLELGPLSLNAGFALLRGYYALSGDHRDAVEVAGAERIGRDVKSREALLSYWDTVLATKPNDLPHSSIVMALKDDGAVIKAFLRAHPDANEPALRTALRLAAQSLSASELTLLVEDALSSPKLPEEGKFLWRFVGLLLDPVHYEIDFSNDLKSAGKQALLDRVNHGELISSFGSLTMSVIMRDKALVQHLGPHCKPTDRGYGGHEDLSQVVAGALKTIAETPTVEASSALAALIDIPGLEDWKDLLKHHIEHQNKARLQATFTAPLPKNVAKALLAGPPATPADLRAVVREVLEDLANRLQNDDTSGWQGFWNYPRDPEKQWPKIENDCRDLLLDRLRDRMFRFGVNANHAVPEAQRRNNRRADILLIGEGAASLPIEAKRHLHEEIWTAGAEQLPDYGRSPGTEGHGIYLVFWFGTEVGHVPNRPKDLKAIKSAEALQTALRARQPAELRPLIDIIVVDVSPPADKRLKPKPKPAKPSARPAAAKPVGRSRKASAKGGAGPSP